MRFLHLTDIHLDHLDHLAKPAYLNNLLHSLDEFANYHNNFIEKEQIDAILLTGDISTSEHLERHLLFLEQNIKAPIYFILGNHDYYHDKQIFNGNSQKVASKIGNGIVLTYTTNKPTILLEHETNKKIAIVGVDGWFDCGYSSYKQSELYMTDFTAIRTFKEAYTYSIQKDIKNGLFEDRPSGIQNGRFFQHFLERGLPPLLAKKFLEVANRFTFMLEMQMKMVTDNDIKEVFVLTHMPPYKENSVFKGKVSDQHWLPYFSNKSLGDFLTNFANKHNDINFTVFCGHSHGDAFNKVLNNLVCHTTKAEHGVILGGKVIEI